MAVMPSGSGGRIELPENVVVSRLDALANWCRKNSLWPMPFATACCGIELMATGAAKHDLARFGAEVFRFSPRQCDLMIVAGRVVMKMLPVLQRIWQQTVELEGGGYVDRYLRGRGLVPPVLYGYGDPEHNAGWPVDLRYHDTDQHDFGDIYGARAVATLKASF
jgi:hypothetical protein